MNSTAVTQTDRLCEIETNATFDGSVKKALSSQSTLLGRGEHCSLDPERLASIGLVFIGGAAPLALKQEIATAVSRVLEGSGIAVRVAQASEQYDGDNPRNIVNRLTAGAATGVQIEQWLEARDGFWMRIADAVASVYDEALARVNC